MSRSAGLPKTGGRKKGTPNKQSLNLECLKNDYAFDVLKELIQSIHELSPDSKVSALLKLMEFVVPKRKSLGKEDEGIIDEVPSKPHVMIYLPDNGKSADSSLNAYRSIKS